jgi:hypothetical protein
MQPEEQEAAKVVNSRTGAQNSGWPQPSPSADMGATLGRVINNYRGLVETCRARADELELSRAEIDRIGGLPAGYAGNSSAMGPPKSRNECGPSALRPCSERLGCESSSSRTMLPPRAHSCCARRLIAQISVSEMSAASPRSDCRRLLSPHRRHGSRWFPPNAHGVANMAEPACRPGNVRSDNRKPRADHVHHRRHRARP